MVSEFIKEEKKEVWVREGIGEKMKEEKENKV